MLEDLRALEGRVVARIKELRPLIEEYEELQRIADRLGFDLEQAPAPAPGRQSRPARAGRRRGKSAAASRKPAATRRRPGGTRATGRARRDRVLALIRERPGITVREISTEMKVDPPPLYRVVRKLQADGVVTKEGTGLRLS